MILKALAAKKKLKNANTLTNVKKLVISPLKYAPRGIRTRVYTTPVRSATNELQHMIQVIDYVGQRKGGGGGRKPYKGGGEVRFDGKPPCPVIHHPAQDIREGGKHCC